MAIGATTVSFSDIRTEFGGSGAVSISDYRRGGTNIRSLAANNNGTNLAANVPTSGVVSFSDYRNQAKGFKYTYTSGATNQDASDLFGDDYSVDYPKEIVINSGVELGTTDTAEFALEIDSGASGDITVTNNGTITGAGGAAGGGAGGDAMRVNASNVTVVNVGTIRGGGGGGNTGGNGGNGSVTTTSYFYKCGTTNGCPSATAHSTCYGGNPEIGYVTQYRCTSSSTSSTTGGTGGAGGRGAGYNQTSQNGSAGTSGGTNAGSGGSGGNGGGFGSAGANGSTGANGNVSNGSAGATGGAAGRAVQNDVSYTMTNTGTLSGAFN